MNWELSSSFGVLTIPCSLLFKIFISPIPPCLKLVFFASTSLPKVGFLFSILENHIVSSLFIIYLKANILSQASVNFVPSNLEEEGRDEYSKKNSQGGETKTFEDWRRNSAWIGPRFLDLLDRDCHQETVKWLHNRQFKLTCVHK